MTGAGPDKHALADKVSAAWTAFARTGGPSIPASGGCPTRQRHRAVMILDDRPRLEIDPYRDERLAISAVKSA
jgi:carboxylesterase type B